LNLKNKKLTQNVETQWNYIFYMIQGVIEQREAITTTLCLL